MNDPRQALAETLGEVMDKDWWEKRIAGSTKTKVKRVRRTCPGCKRANDYDVEYEQIDMRQIAPLLDQALGKPAETKKVSIDVRATTAEEIRELSTEQLLELTAGG